MHIPIVTGFYAGLLGLLLAILIVRVAIKRGQVGVALYDGGNRDLGLMIRQHGNFIETVPLCLILLGIVEMEAFSIYIVHILGIVLLLARIIHPFGLHYERGSIARAIGMGGTLIVLIIVSCLAIYGFVLRAMVLGVTP